MELLPLHGCGESVIREGSLVIVYENHCTQKFVRATAGKLFQNRFGVFRHDDWIGRPFGCKVQSKNDRGYVFLLAPTAELWTCALQHRTQILYLADIALVVALLDLRPGSVVCEAGTGSGSLTHSLARAVAPGGRVHSFEYHEKRAAAAAAEVAANRLDAVASVTCRDVEALGFGAALQGAVDAVFLDLPSPWRAVPFAAEALQAPGGRAGGPGRLCSFSPCVEQVTRTAEALRAHGFVELRTVEVLLRKYELREERLVADLSQDYHAAGRSKDGDAPHPSKRQRSSAATADGAAGGARGAGVVVAAKPEAETKGHTGYLTFATLAWQEWTLLE